MKTPSDLLREGLSLGLAPWRLAVDMWTAMDPESALFRNVESESAGIFGLGLQTAHAGAMTATRLPLAGVDAQELANKLRAFGHFQLRAERPPKDSFDRIWWLEGRGFQHRHPDSVVTASGVGLALALEHLNHSTNPSRLVAGFVAEVERRVPKRFRLAALENLGLAVGNLRPELLVPVAVEAREHHFDGAFWHGSGRGFYFSPSDLLVPPSLNPGNRRGWSSMDRLLARTPVEGHANAVAGLAWALTLVNIRAPEVANKRLRSITREPEATPGRWAVQGMISALTFWLAATDDRVTVDQFFSAAWPSPWSDALNRAWKHHADVFAADSRWADLFQYEPIEEEQVEDESLEG